MSSLEKTAEAAPLKPCFWCRKRKVKCDRLRPCANCSRSKQLCTYEGDDANEGDLREDANNSMGDGDLRERLARLEKMMAAMMAGEKEAQPAARIGLNDTSQTLNGPTAFPTQKQQPPSSTTSPVGLTVYQEGEGVYFASDFWLGCISEV